MAYADFEFYTDSYYGDVLTESTAPKYLEMASDELDTLTWKRLVYGFPEDDYSIARIKKAVCAIADAINLVEVQRKASLAQQTADGSYTQGGVASISSGKESISFSSSSVSSSTYAAAAASTTAYNELIRGLATQYLANVADKYGINLLYAGVVNRPLKAKDNPLEELITLIEDSGVLD